MRICKKSLSFLILQLGFFSFSGCLADESKWSPDQVGSNHDQVDALIFNGEGASDLDARSIASIFREHGRTYQLVNSPELDAMNLEDLKRFRMIVVPGGYGGQMSRSLQPETRERIRFAVVEQGVNYVGFCAGAFVAVGPTPLRGEAPDYGFSIVPHPQLLDYFYPNKDGDDDVAASLPIQFADGTQRQILFWGGPAILEVAGGVVARYSDGTPAIAQVRSGKGFVTISGPHPEGPQEWKNLAGVVDPDGDDFDIAWKLFESTLLGIPVKAF